MSGVVQFGVFRQPHRRGRILVKLLAVAGPKTRQNTTVLVVELRVGATACTAADPNDALGHDRIPFDSSGQTGLPQDVLRWVEFPVQRCTIRQAHRIARRGAARCRSVSAVKGKCANGAGKNYGREQALTPNHERLSERCQAASNRRLIYPFCQTLSMNVVSTWASMNAE